MSIEFIGTLKTVSTSELDAPTLSSISGTIDLDYVRTLARAHEEGGFDSVLIHCSSVGPDGFSVASYAASVTERLRFLIAERPGFLAPTLAARRQSLSIALPTGALL